MKTIVNVVVLAAALCGCGRDEAPPADPAARRTVAVSPSPPPPAAPESLPPRPPPTVRWSNVARTPDCWFFSGPEGRDDQLVGDVRIETVEHEGDKIQIRVGTALFAGTYAHGALALARTSRHDYNGTWSATETIAGRMEGTTLRGTYRYTECDETTKVCPGRCTITGDLVFSRAL